MMKLQPTVIICHQLHCCNYVAALSFGIIVGLCFAGLLCLGRFAAKLHQSFSSWKNDASLPLLSSSQWMPSFPYLRLLKNTRLSTPITSENHCCHLPRKSCCTTQVLLCCFELEILWSLFLEIFDCTVIFHQCTEETVVSLGVCSSGFRDKRFHSHLARHSLPSNPADRLFGQLTCCSWCGTICCEL